MTGKNRSQRQRWGIFNLVGILGFAVQVGMLFVLKHLFRLNLPVATTIAVEIAVLHNFVWHEHVTWPDVVSPMRHGVLTRLVRFHLANGLISIAGNIAITWFFVAKMKLPYLVANAISVLVCSLLNFSASDRLVFRTQRALRSRPHSIQRSCAKSLICFSLMGPISFLCPYTRAMETAPPVRQLTSYALNGEPLAADISPDEKLVATEVIRSQASHEPSKIKTLALVQLWDFRKNELVTEAPLAELATGFETHRWDPHFVRYTPDGQLLVVYLEGDLLYVLDAHNLHAKQVFPIKVPGDSIRSFEFKSRTYFSRQKPRLTILELSPLSHVAALVWTRDFFSQVELYDLETGKELVAWKPRAQGVGIYPPSALAWEHDGKHLVVAAPNSYPCFSPGTSPDVFEVDPLSGRIEASLTSGLLIGDIAVTADGRVWVVDRECVGVLTNHAPKLRVFDLHTGKRLKQIDGRGTGVRYSVSASQDGNEIAAFTGRVSYTFDWGDMVAWDRLVDNAFSVWNSNNYAGIVTCERPPRPMQLAQVVIGPVLRLSAHGSLALFNGRIYELPTSGSAKDAKLLRQRDTR